MKKVFVASDNMITSLGFSTDENMVSLSENRSGLKVSDNPGFTPLPLPLSIVNSTLLEENFVTLVNATRPDLIGEAYTRMEKLFILSICDAIGQTDFSFSDPRTILIISTTKGNIDLLEAENKDLFSRDRLYLWKSGDVISNFFNLHHPPVIISNACISGSVAIGTAFRYLRSGKYENAIVTGGDILSRFVISGFQSFQALSPEPCRPFDISHNGLSLGEGCGTMILTTREPSYVTHPLTIEGFATSNDANHISGPSRTGEELSIAIRNALTESGLLPSQIDFISAHGTATVYNDEMETKALVRSGFGQTPVNSFKGYWGHTLGAAGMLESIASVRSMANDLLIASAGFSDPMAEDPLNVLNENRKTPVRNVVKTASGFGGCNAALVFQKM